MAKATGMQTTTETGSAASTEEDLAAALRAAQHAVAALGAAIAALGLRLDEMVPTQERQRTEYAEGLAGLRLRCDALAAERDRAVEAADRAEARIGQLRAHLKKQMECDHAFLTAFETCPGDSDAACATRRRRARNGKTSPKEHAAPCEAGPAEPSAAGAKELASERASGEVSAGRTGEDPRRVAIAPLPEHGSERPNPIEDAVMVTVPVPRGLFIALEHEVAAGSFSTVGAALLARCDVRCPAPAVCAFSQEPGDAQNRTEPQSPAPDSS